MTKWQLILYHATAGTHTVVSFPEGFENIKYGLNRDANWWGIFSEFAGSLRFIKDGKTWIDSVVDTYGYETEAFVYFKKYSTTNGMYETKKTARFNFATYQRLEDYTEIGFDDSSFITKLRSRYELEVEFNKSTTIEGISLPGFVTPYVDDSLRGIAAATNTRAIFPYELFTSIIQQITDSDYQCFDSLIFGRAGAVYAEDGKYSGVLFANGMFIRGYDETETKFTISLKFLFEEMCKITPLGLKVYYDSLSRPVVYIGLRSEFFVSSVVYTLPKDKILTGMKKEPCSEFMIKKINVGYQNTSKDNNLGQSEFNVKAEYVTPIVIFDNSLSIVSQIRADGTAIEDCRTTFVKGGVNDTKESEYDKQIFIIDSIYESGAWKSRQQEDIQNSGSAYIYNNLALYFNIRFSPAHNLLNYGEFIGVGLQKMTTSQIKILKHEKLSSAFQSQYKDDTDIVYENLDINISALSTPFFSENIYRFQSPLDLDELSDIEDQPEGLIKFWSNIENKWAYMWIEKDVSTSPIDIDTNWNGYEALNFTEVFGCLLLMTGGYLRLASGGRLKLATEV